MTAPGRELDLLGSLAIDGVLTPRQLAGTVAGIRRIQRADGSIPWFAGGHLDPWDHVEAAMALDTAGESEAAAAAYEWSAAHQNPDGSWFAGYTGGEVSDQVKDANFTGYIAVGVWHHYLTTKDTDFLADMWPVVDRAMGFVCDLQLSWGGIGWHRNADGESAGEALLAGSSSLFQALRCSLAMAEELDRPQPEWELACTNLGDAIRTRSQLFLPKHRYSMDWYYPVLGTALRGSVGARRIAESWDRFVLPGLGARCVDDHPWVTGGETAELALSMWALGEEDRARTLIADIQHLRADDGLYWTGYVYADKAIWPQERTAWTAGSMLLALAALAGDPATVAVFGGELPGG